jgi:1,2-phenylacetyl-CoA epoxidase catalytic subunit
LVPEIRRLRIADTPIACHQFLLNHPTTMLVRIKAMTAEAAMVTATAIRKLNNSTVMMFLSKPKGSWTSLRRVFDVGVSKMFRAHPTQRGRGK